MRNIIYLMGKQLVVQNKMRNYFLLFSLLLLVCEDSGELLVPWFTYFQTPDKPKLTPITKSEAGRNYLRGFQRGLYGTILFPASNDHTSTGDNMYTFWFEYFKTKTIPGSSVEKDFEDFINFTKNYFCKTDRNTPWTCCTLTPQHPDCGMLPAPAMEVANLFSDPKEGLPLVFLYHWCVRAWVGTKNPNAEKNLKKDALEFCPNPCHGTPCRSIKAAVNVTECEVLGPFEDDFQCQCERGYEWDQHLSVCTPRNPCLDELYPPCVLDNTIQCIAGKDREVHCICKAEFMGPDCSLPRDACVERVNKSEPNGNENCQVRFGNRCNPIFGTDYYTCHCLYGYVPLLTTTESNCFGRYDPCKAEHFGGAVKQNTTEVDVQQLEEDPLGSTVSRAFVIHRSLTCLNGGQCLSSPDLTRAVCVCRQSSQGVVLFTGLNCETAVGVWSTWSVVSPCFPKDCGRTRYNWRRRKCLNTSSSKDMVNLSEVPPEVYSTISPMYKPSTICPGTSEEVLSCDMMEPCATLRLSGRIREEIFDYSSLFYFGYITIAEVIFSCLVWYVFANPTRAFLYARKHKKPAKRVR
ncbi:hypothetical protein D915_003512 [Fasciola hepatica]|uniref:EGF-like domain-containing protein n=1 Tax=Fasciola hepatica TaxID=6192 RepID=A0A4E0RFN9_FASHE|nr:hypothetical protein D915_003512 [Fasciola hepatica]